MGGVRVVWYVCGSAFEVFNIIYIYFCGDMILFVVIVMVKSKNIGYFIAKYCMRLNKYVLFLV